MLHDLARLYSEERLLAECARRGMPIEPYERAHPLVLHARLGAELAAEMFDLHDSAVLSAIRKHTLADPQMSALDHILYLADALEPGRTFDQRAALASLAMRDLHEATRATLRVTVAHLRERGLDPAPKTLAAMQALGVPSAREELTGRSA
jgi:predicted HD superfamily hydrolase involved in NAD metabolism